MAARKMHVDELDIDVALVRRLLTGQFPGWADLPVEAVDSAGTDNAMYRLGDTMAVRLPRIHWATGQVAKEHEWLPRLAPQLPLAIPGPLGKGEPAKGYPWSWSIYTWLDGENATAAHVRDEAEMATDLAGFIAALQHVDGTGGPAPCAENFFRGAPLASRDAQTRAALDALRGVIDVDAAARAWAVARDAPEWTGSSVWIHGDLQAGNLLAVDGRLSAVIDFGGLGVGDPACDVMVAWSLFSSEARPIFRRALHVDDATWARGRGWALSTALVGLPYYLHTNPDFVRSARRTIHEVLTDDVFDPSTGMN